MKRNEIVQGFYLFNLGQELYDLYGKRLLDKEIEEQVKDLLFNERYIFVCKNKDPEIIKHILTTLFVYNTKRRMQKCIQGNNINLDPNRINLFWGHDVITVNDLMKITNPFSNLTEDEWTINDLVAFDVLFIKESDEYPNKMHKHAISQIVNLRDGESKKTIIFCLKREPKELIDEIYLQGHFKIIDINCSSFNLTRQYVQTKPRPVQNITQQKNKISKIESNFDERY